jgi:cyclopropane fatty-acyl-phospholipid synthase-like methyltransferase
MSRATPTYRWNTSVAAEAYDAAAPDIHPHYESVQNTILDQLPFAADESIVVADLGAGSGRLVQRLLVQFSNARAWLVDQSEPFLALAERKLQPFASRTSFIQRRLQDDWATELTEPPNAIVSTSAIHHLEPVEKRALFSRCYAALKPGGLFINGDEYRPADDIAYRALLKDWSAHMYAALDAGRIPESFRQTIDNWYGRNIRRFDEPKKSGDDCLETIETQVGYLREAGFASVEVAWADKLWAVVVAKKSANQI